MLKKLITFNLIPLSFFVLISCSTSDNSSLFNAHTLNNKSVILGKAIFPESKFKTKAIINDIAPNATISLIYPPDESNPNLRNATIATGLTQSDGSFSIFTSELVSPQSDDIFILEATKRLGGVGNNLLSIRTYIKKTSTGWDSINVGSVLINEKTTALSIIADNNTSTISANDTIGKINSGVITPIGSITSTIIDDLVTKVSTVLSENRDPFLNIKYQANEYIINRESDLGTLLQTGACIGCNFQGVDLSEVDLSNKNLTDADLSGQNLTLNSLSGTNLTNAKLIKTNLENQDLSNTTLNGVDFTDAYLVNASLINRNLTNTKFIYAFMSGADLTDATFSNTDFTNADLRSVVWNNGTICNETTSFGQCNN